jgi:hypothetical protein
VWVKKTMIGALMVCLSACATTSHLDRLNCESEQPPDRNVRDIGSEELYQHLKDVPRSNEERAATLIDRFGKVGCRGNSLKIATQRPARLPNIICKLTGSDDRTIVIGAHYDKTSRGRGIVDNWTGASLLPILYQHLRGQPLQHTFLFVGFAEEELDLVGSKAFVRSLSGADLEQMVAMVNLDTFGLTVVKVDTRSAPHLVCRLFATAKWRQLPLQVANMREPISGDWEPFRSKGVPIVNLHSITRSGLKVIHSNRDKLESVHEEHYYDTYRLVNGYLNWLDATLTGKGSS